MGSGRTAALAVEMLAARIAKEGLRLVSIPTSERTANLARRFGVPLTDFAEYSQIDLTIDGADQVEERSLHLVKGLGGALLREKIVAAASRRMLVVVDEGKLVPRLGNRTPLPVEISAFGWQTVIDRLAKLGAAPTLRTLPNGEPFQTDGGNLIADCRLPADVLGDAANLERSLAAVVGVVEVGLFIGLASQVVVGARNGVRVLERSNKSARFN